MKPAPINPTGWVKDLDDLQVTLESEIQTSLAVANNPTNEHGVSLWCKGKAYGVWVALNELACLRGIATPIWRRPAGGTQCA